jgi:uroporphyrinogen decarboxylase
MIRQAGGKVPLIGFRSALDLASYMVEGGGSKSYVGINNDVQAGALSRPDAEDHRNSREVPARAGRGRRETVQLFDSWAGASPARLPDARGPWSARIVKAAEETGVPVIHFVYDGGSVLEQVRDTGADVVNSTGASIST